MIDRIYIKCNYCKTNILLRFQLGEFDIPFSFNCPNCNVNINGIRRIVSNNFIELNNAIQVEETEPEYYEDLAVELPHRKIQKYVSFETMYYNGISPFMDMIKLFKDPQDYMNIMKSIGSFMAFKVNDWDLIKSLYDLYFGNRIDLIQDPIIKFSPNYIVNNKLDATMALHQLTIVGLNKILESNSLEEFMKYSSKIMGKENIAEVKKFVKFIKNNMDFDFELKRIIKVYSRWIEDFEKYIPIVTISLGNLREKFNKENYGIATMSFENMINFYKDTYELLLDMVTFAVGLNNIFTRGKYDSFSDKTDILNFEKYNNLVKSQRLKALIQEEPFSKCISMNRNVRNAIAHYTYDFDSKSQKIYFYDKHKNNESIVELYLCDLALLCYDNIRILVYLNELFYSLRKIDFIESGMIPNIRF